ncbi:probable pectate lyase 12 isoform X2 [Beta vulgaris subsp. vulgaris]|uniref:probable pectate lyase 12 isoform X2 n=1 Tax=Beta vulgaris subsp. vulgaris TaxID=3555 RepID=UPI0020370DE2|nr:probable pectate lyase 12 isoform X2 [Beta vulgaris subsp. vulgaris]
MLQRSYIVQILVLCYVFAFGSSILNLTLPGQHPDPEAVAREVHRKVNVSLARRHLLEDEASNCMTGNPIDDCWRCDPNWHNNRQRLADCGIGFGQYALGGKGGEFYVVTDPSDDDAVNPKPGTLRYAVIRTEPLWIVFASNMVIHLSQELIFNSYKTLDGRGADVHITGGGCIMLQFISNIIIHNIHVHHCYQSGNTMVRSSPTHYGYRSLSDGDGISVFGSKDLWIDHCSLSHCKDGLIDIIMGSTGITVSNNHFSHHNEVMLLGHSDTYEPDTGMQVTKRVDTNDNNWKGWNWRSEGDEMMNGAYFVASGAGVEVKYEKAYSVEPKSAANLDQLVMYAGVLGDKRHSLGKWTAGPGEKTGLNSDDYDYNDDYDGGTSSVSSPTYILLFLLLTMSFLYLYAIPIINFL